MAERATRRAIARLMAVAATPGPDRRTSLADARTALCLARGTAIADIDPATGYDYSDAAYETVRASWRTHAENWSEDYDPPRYEAARAQWARHRPDLTDDWLAGIDTAGGAR
ncbi:hypothetical protein [Streptomyces sp. NBRC 109706]|uniref:hypothetical protein n=1 Tax=Streptomyces sp. NBRC 109706 TaxID=1550035 RepID=UPI000B09D1EC|nr:hypothetical protein [Streptomyces sp. NBRC 109706]